VDVVRRDDGWWIINLPSSDSECGAYDTRKQAEEDLRGLRRFYQEWMKEMGEGTEAVGSRACN